MKSKRTEHNRSADDVQAAIDEILGTMFAQARAQFGDAIRSFWFYDGDLCPGCMKRLIGPIKAKGKDALAINAFIYRKRGVLIGYFLCQACAKYIFAEARKNPFRQTPKHGEIEQNLTAAYHKHLSSLEA
jgi:hypothetical protein